MVAGTVVSPIPGTATGNGATFTQMFVFFTVPHTRVLAASNCPSGLHDLPPFVVSFPTTVNQTLPAGATPHT
ncbi:MAG: hypothetical protein EBU67_06120 [Actinobacteria bacterium]|nr:hypothetical protein [Actinomycetota bacterium]